MKEIKLQVEELEERIAPSFMLTVNGTPNDPTGGGQAGFEASFGPDSGGFPSQNPDGLAAWNAHEQSPVLVNGGNA
jgi:hypothetical protein